MITEDYCSLEVTKLLGEKGMNKSNFTHYIQKNNKDGTSEAVSVCTHQMAMKWLRKKYDILISIIPQEVKIGVDRLCYAIYRITEDLYQPL